MSAIPLASAQPGDIVAFESKGLFGSLIGLGQWIRHKDRRYRRFHHIAVITSYASAPSMLGVKDPQNWMCTQAARRVDERRLSEIGNGCPYTVFACPPGVSREYVVAQATQLVGAEYGVLSILSIALNILTPSFFHLPSIREDGTWICSALGAWALHAGGWRVEAIQRNIYEVTPADLVGALS